ncbi:MAG TPA: hypothetical protein VH307_27875 [Streptosporangiaceae bacterium]|jgi:dolichyl-phosphate-mannose--protein O-mannosyl transferase|nr:hypothetical protein [Streptosporangiaceae bacterium]
MSWGNLLTSVGTRVWMLAFGVLCPVLLAILLHEVTFRRLDST